MYARSTAPSRRKEGTMMEKAFCTGDYVVYSINGVCVIDDICVRRLTPDMPENKYYVLKPVASAMSTVFVPCDNEKLCSRMRRMMTKDEIISLIEDVKGRSLDWIDDRKERAAAYREVLLRGDRTEIMMLISCLFNQSVQLAKIKKKLSASDNEILQSAQKTVKEEFSYALDMDPDDVIGYLRDGLELAEV